MSGVISLESWVHPSTPLVVRTFTKRRRRPAISTRAPSFNVATTGAFGSSSLLISTVLRAMKASGSGGGSDSRAQPASRTESRRTKPKTCGTGLKWRFRGGRAPGRRSLGSYDGNSPQCQIHPNRRTRTRRWPFGVGTVIIPFPPSPTLQRGRRTRRTLFLKTTTARSVRARFHSRSYVQVVTR